MPEIQSKTSRENWNWWDLSKDHKKLLYEMWKGKQGDQAINMRISYFTY